jgi:hypothetical protein
MSRIVRKCTLFRFAALLLWSPLFGQSAPPATQLTTFHIRGTITGFEYGHSLAVVFEGASSETVITNEAGVYEADLPLGLWTMTVGPYGPDGKIFTNMIRYRRPQFRVTAPTSLVFDISLPRGMFCTMAVGGPDGGPPTQELQDHMKGWCAGEEFFSVPSASVPFEVHVWGGLDFASCWLSAKASGKGDDSVACKRAFATYNTLSVQADDIAYDPGESILEAHGNVVTQDESGEHKAPSMTFKIQDGRAFPIQQSR